MDEFYSHPVIIFDGECHLCGAWVDFVIRHDRNDSFRFAPRQSDAGRRLLTQFGVKPDDLGSIALVFRQGIYTRSDAVLRIFSHLGFPWNVLACVRVVPRPLRDLGYSLLARNRYRLSRGRGACRVTHPDNDGRFLQ
jgi:predicted DCC family thiol-disulfide oxidoreductase YuxK